MTMRPNSEKGRMSAVRLPGSSPAAGPGLPAQGPRPVAGGTATPAPPNSEESPMSSLSGTPFAPGRIAPLAKLPVFFDLQDKLCIVVGGSAAAAWKAELLAAAGARVKVRCGDVQPGTGAACGSPAPGRHDRAGPACLLGGGFRRRRHGRRRSRNGTRDRAVHWACPGGRCSDERDRRAGPLRFPVRQYRQPVARRRRYLDQRGRAGPCTGRSRPNRGPVARCAGGLGAGGKAGAAKRRQLVSEPPAAPRLLGSARGAGLVGRPVFPGRRAAGSWPAPSGRRERQRHICGRRPRQSPSCSRSGRSAHCRRPTSSCSMRW